MARVSREEWAARVERWKDSGLTAAEFASELGVKEATLRHWKWQLGHLARTAAQPRSPRRRSRPAQFVEVVAPKAAVAEFEPFEVLLGDELRIRVPARFDPTSLRHLVDALRGR